MTKILQKMNLTVTPIVAYGIVFLVLLLSWFGVERLGEVKKSLANEATGLSARRAIVENIKAQDQWADRLAHSILLKEQMDASIWKASTGGVVAAELQQFLKKVTDINGFKNVSIRVDPAPAKLGKVSILAFDFAGVVDVAAGSINLLEQFSRNERQIIVNDVNIIYDPHDRRSTRVVLSGFIPVELSTRSVQ